MWIWYRCQNRIGKYYHNDGEQLCFYEKVHIKTHRLSIVSIDYGLSKEKGVLVIFVLQEMKNSNSFDWQKPYSRERQMQYSTWRKLTWVNRNWRGKLQVTLLFAYISWKKWCSHTFKASYGRSNRDTFWKNEGKIHEGGVVKEFFW